ncbi:MAG: hypothetical protein IH877_08275 [Gemmatimonadetes bacterium]|nr:hypothetical protein [Gemmatimonadota bacterium]
MTEKQNCLNRRLFLRQSAASVLAAGLWYIRYVRPSDDEVSFTPDPVMARDTAGIGSDGAAEQVFTPDSFMVRDTSANLSGSDSIPEFVPDSIMARDTAHTP